MTGVTVVNQAVLIKEVSVVRRFFSRRLTLTSNLESERPRRFTILLSEEQVDDLLSLNLKFHDVGDHHFGLVVKIPNTFPDMSRLDTAMFQKADVTFIARPWTYTPPGGVTVSGVSASLVHINPIVSIPYL